jgi:acetyltransferase-like isoleucine patch superfamily enzyme
MTHKLLLLYSYFIRIILFIFPDIPIIMRLRGLLYSFGMKSCGRNFQVSSSSTLKGINNFSVGNDCYLAPNTVISAGMDIQFSNEVMVGYNSIIIDGNHTQIDVSYRFGPSLRKPINIESGVWLAANVVVIGGVSICSGCLVSANTVVYKNLSQTGIYSSLGELRQIK